MNKQISIFIALLFCICSFANIAEAREKAEKVITKSFNVDKTSNLSIENKYGNIQVKTWNKNEIYFEVKIKVEASTQKEVQEITDAVDIEFSQSGNTVSAKTVYKNMNCNNCSRDVNYQVMVPDGINYNITNSYGNVNLPDIKGNANLTVKYGNVVVGNLAGSKNTIDVKYGNRGLC